MKKIAIVIVNWNGHNDTIECLNSLSKVNTQDLEISVIVVDNGSEEKSLSKIIKHIQKLNSTNTIFSFRTVELSKNTGFSGGNNAGIRQAINQKVDYIWLLNNDTLVDRDGLSTLVTFMEEYSQVGIAGSKIYFAKGYEYHKKRYKKGDLGKVIWYAGGYIDWSNVIASHRGVDQIDEGQYNTKEPTDFVTGCSFFIRSKVIEKVGYLDDNYFLYLEDLDYCIRAIKQGFELWYVPDSIVWHKNAQSSDKPGSETHIYYQTRNRLLFGMKYAPFRTKLALIREAGRMIKSNEVSKQAVTDFFMRRLGKRK